MRRISLIIVAYRADGVTRVIPGTVFADETIYYEATIRAPGSPNAAVEGGTITLTTPDGKEHDITPEGGIGCVGGSIEDPAAATNDGRGHCAGAPREIVSRRVAHTFTAAEVANVIRVEAR